MLLIKVDLPMKHNANEIQRKAICHLNGPAQILAGPGSGKTFTIIKRVRYLTETCKITPSHILVVTFTKAAALEMKERYTSEVHLSNLSNTVNFGTFHSICFHILKESGGFNASSLINESDKRKLAEILLRNRGLESMCDYDTVSEVLNQISRLKNQPALYKTQINTPESSVKNQIFPDFLYEYNHMLDEQKRIDFDDMILKCVELLTAYPDILKTWQLKYKYILVDEFQDINQIQYDVMKLLSLPENNLFVVGDDDQAIYGFRGAAPGIMRKFLSDYPFSQSLVLNTNYRSTLQITDAAAKIIIHNKDRFEKQIMTNRVNGSITIRSFQTRQEEEQALVQNLTACEANSLYQTAVIVRTNQEINQYAGLLTRNLIPVKTSENKHRNCLNHFIMDDVDAFFSFIYEGNSRTHFLKIMNKPNLFLTRQALSASVINEADLLNFYKCNTKMQKAISTLFGDYSRTSHFSPYLAFHYFRKTMGYDKYLLQKTDRGESIEQLLKTADEIQQLFKAYKDYSAYKKWFSNQKSLSPQNSNPLQDIQIIPGVSVITMHASKGLEFKRVFLPDINEGVIPGKRAVSVAQLEEERRLLYVAITRAKDSLYIYYTGERNRMPSRFIRDLIPHPPQ